MKKELKEITDKAAEECKFNDYEYYEITAFCDGVAFLYDELGYQFTKEDMRKCWEAARKYFEGKSDKNFNDFIDSN